MYQLTQINADAAEMVQRSKCSLIRHGRRASSKDPLTPLSFDAGEFFLPSENR
jgi:hypothetical protein